MLTLDLNSSGALEVLRGVFVGEPILVDCGLLARVNLQSSVFFVRFFVTAG